MMITQYKGLIGKTIESIIVLQKGNDDDNAQLRINFSDGHFCVLAAEYGFSFISLLNDEKEIDDWAESECIR